jgi:hypothetical protein
MKPTHLVLGLTCLGMAAAILLTATAHAETVETHATMMPCPDGSPGVAVVATDANGNESWAGCWDTVSAQNDEPRQRLPQRPAKQ